MTVARRPVGSDVGIKALPTAERQALPCHVRAPLHGLDPEAWGPVAGHASVSFVPGDPEGRVPSCHSGYPSTKAGIPP